MKKIKALFASLSVTRRELLLLLSGSAILAFGLYQVHSISGVTEGGVLGLTLLWLLLNVVGVFDQVTQIVSSTGLDAGGFDLANVLSLSTVLSAVTIFSIIEVVLFTVLVVILTLLYNVVSTLVGGIHVTLGDD